MLKRILNYFRQRVAMWQRPGPRRLAAQLRRPSGALGQRVGAFMHRSNAALYAFAVQQLALRHGEEVLEIGFGSGRHFSWLLEQVPGIRLRGLDFSPDMVRQAAQVEGPVAVVLSSSDHMPFADSTFDVVFCVNVIYFWEYPERHLEEIRRVLRPGGRFLAAVRTPESMAALPFTRHGFRLYDAEGWSVLLERAGFSAICSARHMEPALLLEGQQVVLESLCITGVKT